MTRLLHALALAALILLSVLSIDARLAGVRADDYADCTRGSGDTRLRGCTRIINPSLFGPISKKNLTIACYNRGIAYGISGQYDRAIADYDTAIMLSPKDSIAYIVRGISYEGKGQYDRAIADYDTAIMLSPNYDWAYYNRGEAYKGRGNKERAIVDFRKVLELRPGDKLATEGLKRLGVTP